MPTRSKDQRIRPLHLASIGVVAMALFSGCASNRSAPRTLTTGEQAHEVNNALVDSTRTNKKLLLEDLGRLFMLDRPSRLSPRPIPH